MSSAFGRKRIRERVLVAIVLATTIASPLATVTPALAAEPEPTTAPPVPQRADPVDDGRRVGDARDGRVVEAPIVELGLPSAAGPGGGNDGIDATNDPSVALRPVLDAVRAPDESTAVAWSERTETIANPDGTYSLTVASGRLNYLDEGTWRRLDLTAIPSVEGPYRLAVASSDRDVKFGGRDAGDALARVASSLGEVSVRALDYPSTLTSETVPEPSDPTTPEPTPSVDPTIGPDPTVAPTPVPTASASPSDELVPSASVTPSGEPSLAPATVSPSVAPSATLDPTASPGSPTPAPTETPTAAPSALTPEEIAEDEAARAAAVMASDGRLVFRSDSAKPDVFARATDSGFEYGLILASADQGGAFAFALDVGPLESSLRDDGGIDLFTVSFEGDAVKLAGGISAPVVLDANEVPAPAGTVTVSIVDPGDVASISGLGASVIEDARPGEQVVTYTIDQAWLNAPGRAFPLTLDPYVCLGEGASGCDINGTATNFDHFVGSGIASAYPTGWTTFRVGYDSRTDDGDTYGSMRGLVYFQDVALPDGAVVYDTNLRLNVSSLYGSPVGNTVYAYRITEGWGQTTTWNQWSSGVGYETTDGVSATVPSSGYMTWDTDAIVQSWYTRRGHDWQGDLGFAIRMSPDSSGNGEVNFDRYNDDTASNRPLLTMTYEIPRVSVDFDPALGANYSPSTMLAGTPTTLPILVTNDASGFDFDTTNWRMGYRWFDADGELVAAASEALTACIGNGAGCSSPLAITLDVDPPATAGQYALRLDLVRNGTVDQYASDWASPSKFYARNKQTLSPESTRWTGTSVIERTEFGMAVVDGRGVSGVPRTVATGNGGTLTMDLWSADLRYEGPGGVGFQDLIPMRLDYRYDSAATTECGGILDACGWSTNWDERFVDTNGDDDAYDYVDRDGNRHLVDSDPDGQLVSGAPLLLGRPRVTLFDELVPSNTPVAQLVQPSFGPYSGTYSVEVSAVTQPAVVLGDVPTASLNVYRNVRFAMRTDGAASAGLRFKIRNATTGDEAWFAYTVGTAWTTGIDQVDLGQTISTAWRSYAANLYQDVRDAGFGGTYDDFEMIDVQVANRPGMTGKVYLDALRLESNESTIIGDSNPAWTAGSGLTSLTSADVAVGTSSVRVNAAPISTSPDCSTSGCWSPTAGGMWSYGFTHWQWKKVGGSSAVVVFHLQNMRTGATDDLTYFAGPTPPVGAVNPVQVADVAPSDWSRVTRNLLQDARQVLNYFNDNAGGTSPSAPPSQGPTADQVKIVGYRVSAVDGSFVLIDDVAYGSLPDIGADQRDQPDTVGDPTFTYDYTATSRDGEVRFFNALGLLERIENRDGHRIDLDWSIPDTSDDGPEGYQLERIHAPSDASVSGSWTYDREFALTHSASNVTLTERLGTTGTPVTGRKTIFYTTSGDITKIKPARSQSCAGAGVISRCDIFAYAGTHLLEYVGDPRWDQTTTSGIGDARFQITWAGTRPTAVLDRAQSAATPILRAFTTSTVPSPAASRVAWQDAAGLRANDARFVDITSDGRVLIEYIPRGCQTTDCASLPSTSSLGSWKAMESQFDGLARVTTTTTYRCPDVDTAGCVAVSAQPVIARQGTEAGAKVDNYHDPLTAGQVSWTQSADQYVASLRDSSGADGDLYRSYHAYDEHGQPVAVSRPAHDARADFAATVKSTPQAASALKGYWRLGETSGVSATDQAPTPHSGDYVGGYTLNQADALVNDSNSAVAFNGTTGHVTVPGFGTLTGSFSVGAWIRPDVASTTMAWIGSRKGTTSTTDYTFDAKLRYDTALKRRFVRLDIGNGSAWLLTHDFPFEYEANQWYHVVAVVDDATDQATVYVDGDPVGVAKFTTAGSPRFSDGTRIPKIGNNGRDSTSPEWFDGRIDEVAIYGQVLTSPQVRTQFLAGRSVAMATVRTLRDGAGRPLQVDDQWLASPGFESGLVDWDFGAGTTGSIFLAADPATSTNVHQPLDPSLPPSWSSFKTGLTGNAQQDVQLVPGQSVRFQVWQRRAGTTPTARINLYTGSDPPEAGRRS